MLGTLGPAHASLLDAMLRAPLAWMSPAELAHFVNSDVDHISDLLCDLDASGMVEISDTPRGPVVTFSSATIRGLDLDLVEVGTSFRWRRSCARSPRRSTSREQWDPNAIIDPSPSAELLVDEADELAGGSAQSPRPRTPAIAGILSGPSPWPWDELGWPRPHSIECRHCRKPKRKKMVLRTWCECGRGLRSTPSLDVCVTCLDRPSAHGGACLRCLGRRQRPTEAARRRA